MKNKIFKSSKGSKGVPIIAIINPVPFILCILVLIINLTGCLNINITKTNNQNKTLGNNISIEFIYPDFFIKKDKLFYDMYGALYDYAMEVDEEGFKSLLAKENITSKQDMFDICMNPNYPNKDMHTYGRIFGKYYLANDMRKDIGLEDRIAFQKTKENFFSKIIDEEKYKEFLKFTVIFFYYWRLDEVYTGYSANHRDPRGCEYFANSYATIIDIAKFFHYSKKTLPSYFNGKTVPTLYDEIPGVIEEDLIYKINKQVADESEIIDLPSEYNIVDFEFKGWYLNEDFSENSMVNISVEDAFKNAYYNEESGEYTLKLYAKFEAMNLYDERIEKLEYPWF